ncbi:MAG: hypothetical protein HQL40_20615 [Alphaproteobacteria bacterium]|nr:hypothetical protein [Alphaproteobacteria bacterium]
MGARDISLPVLMRIHSLFGVGHTVEDVHRMLNEEPAEVDPRADDLLAAQASLLAHQADALGQRIGMLTGQLRSVGLRPAPGYDGAMADDLVPARLEELSATVHALRHEVAGLRGGVPAIATDDGAVIDGGAIGDALQALAATLTELPRRVASEVDRAVAARFPDGAASARPQAPQAPAQIREAPQPQPPQARPQHDAPPLPLHLFSRIESRPFSLDMLWRKHLFEVPARARMWLVMAPLLIALGAAAAYILVSPDAAELLELLLTGLDEK